MRGSLRWRVLVVLSLAAVVPTVIVGVLAIARTHSDVEREVARGALAHIRALGAALDGTLQDARRTVELVAAAWADAPDDARETQLSMKRLRRDLPIVHALSVVDPEGKLLYGDPLPAGVDIGSHSFGGYIGDATFVANHPVVRLVVSSGALSTATAMSTSSSTKPTLTFTIGRRSAYGRGTFRKTSTSASTNAR